MLALLVALRLSKNTRMSFDRAHMSQIIPRSNWSCEKIQISTMCKTSFSWGQSYSLTFSEPHLPTLLLATVGGKTKTKSKTYPKVCHAGCWDLYLPLTQVWAAKLVFYSIPLLHKKNSPAPKEQERKILVLPAQAPVQTAERSELL